MPAVTVEQARRHLRLEAVLEIPDVDGVPERLPKHGGEAVVVALADEADGVLRCGILCRRGGVRVVPGRVDERSRAAARAVGRAERLQERLGRVPGRGRVEHGEAGAVQHVVAESE